MWVWGFGVWCLGFGVWCLGFGVYISFPRMIYWGLVGEHVGEEVHGCEHVFVLLGEAQHAQVLRIAREDRLAQLVKLVLQRPPHLHLPENSRVTKPQNTPDLTAAAGHCLPRKVAHGRHEHDVSVDSVHGVFAAAADEGAHVGPAEEELWLVACVFQFEV